MDDRLETAAGPPPISKTDVFRVRVLGVETFRAVLCASGLGERRPVDDVDRLARMIHHANLIVIARDEATGRVVGVCRSLSDFAWSCYVSDLAVDRAWQGRGIGRRLLEKTREIAGPGVACVLAAAPGAESFYSAVGMEKLDRGFLYHRDPGRGRIGETPL